MTAPFKTAMPATCLLACVASAFHFDLLHKPWTTQMFWSSKSSLVCLSSNLVIQKGQWIRLVSAPLEHQGLFHFLLSTASLAFKVRFLETQSTRKWSLLTLICSTLFLLLGTSVVYVALSLLAEDLVDYRNSTECVQGRLFFRHILGTVFFRICSPFPWFFDYDISFKIRRVIR